MRETLNKLLAEATGQPMDRVARDVDRDYIMSAEQAMEYGMIDRVITQPRTGSRSRFQALSLSMRLKDKVAIVTGVGAGIGEAIAIRFAEEGARLVLVDIHEVDRPGDAGQDHLDGRHRHIRPSRHFEGGGRAPHHRARHRQLSVGSTSW